ncbi:MAG: glucosaminidase domain-containing protein [Anaerovibrio sp.]|nr:glucosaminidase domain-containing protein [Anaerovibrio sp.]
MNYIKYFAKIFVFALIISGLLGCGTEMAQSREIQHRLAHYKPVLKWEKLISRDDMVSIMGPATVSQEQMVRYILSRNPNPKINCSLEELVAAYYQEAGDEGIRPDVALCQALKETGFFNYGNDVKPAQNNFCGLGATGNKEPGYSFYTPRRGVRAHIQHLIAYATTRMPRKDMVDPRFSILVEKYPQYHGSAQYWPDLNGRWAVPGTTYGQEILKLWREAQSFRGETTDLSKAIMAAKAEPTSIGAWERVYWLAISNGNYPEAVNSMDAVLNLDGKNGDAYVKRGNVYREWGYNEKALADYNSALALDKHNYDALAGRAYLYAVNQKTKKALADYNTMLNMYPGDTVALYNHGCLMADERHYDEALDDLEMVLTLDPDNEYAKLAYDDLMEYAKK